MSLKQTLSLYLYASATRLLRPFVSRFLKERVKKGKEDAARIDERKGIASKARPKGKMLWLHAASIGEFMSLMPLIQRLNAQNLNVLVTTGTLTSASIAAQRLPNNALHQFVPLDIPAYMERFFDHWQPDLVLLTESEIWPNLISCAVKKAIPIGIVNGRLSERSFLRWKNAPSFIGTLLSKMEFCLTQTREDETRFTALGAKQVQHTGNLKFDCKPLPFDEDALESFLDVSRGRKLWLAASTHEGEEALIVEAHHQIKQKYPDILTVIVPRHPERGTTLADIMRLNGLDVRLRSKSEMPVADTDIYIADTIGELGLFYRASKAALIGCSLVAPGGGHNPIEAAQLGTLIMHGPYIRNFISVYSALEGEGCLEVSNAKDIASALDTVFSDDKYCIKTASVLQNMVGQHGGGADKIISVLQPYIDRPVL